MPPGEAALDLGDERGEEGGRAVVALGDVLAFARGVVDRLPGCVDLGEPLAEDGGMGGARMEACAGFDVRVPFAEAWRALFRAVLDLTKTICVPCSAYIGTFNAIEMGFDVCKHRSA